MTLVLRVMIEGRDRADRFFASFDVELNSIEDTEAFFRELAGDEGWDFVRIEEMEVVKSDSARIRQPRLLQRTGRAYFES